MSVSEMLKDEMKKGVCEIVNFRIGGIPDNFSNKFASDLTTNFDIEKQLEYIVDECWQLLIDLITKNESYREAFFEKVKCKYGVNASNKEEQRSYLGNSFYSTYKPRLEDAFWEFRSNTLSTYLYEVANPIRDELRNYDLDELPDHRWPRGRDVVEYLETFSELIMDSDEYMTAIDIFWEENDFI